MVNMPEIYRKSSDLIQSIDWVDLSTNIGYIDFLAGVFYGDDEKLVTQEFYSDEQDSSRASNGDIMDRTFITTFGIGRLVGGDAVIQIPHSAVKGTAGAANYTFTNVITFYKNSTQIATGTIIKVFSTPGSFGINSNFASGIITLPLTFFGVGDEFKIRIVSSVTGISSGAAGTGHDPFGRTAGITLADGGNSLVYSTTKLTCSIPFRIYT